MNNTVRCKNCGTEGSLNEIKLYNIPGKTNNSQFLCQECYNKIKSKNQHTIKCPSCNKPIFYDATWCPYCGKSIVKNKEKQKKCEYCGTEIKEKTNYCPFCGEFTNDQNIKKINYEKKIFIKPKKILGIIIIIILLITLFFGYEAFTSTVSNSQNIFNKYNPNAIFTLVSSDFMDYQGELSLKINYIANDGIEIRILNDNHRLISSTNIKKDEGTKLIKTPILQKEVMGSFYTIIAKSGSKIIYEKTIFYKGVCLKTNYPICEWQNINGLDKLKNISITITNKGDMPAYINNLEITIDTINGPYKCELKEAVDNDIILQEQTKTISFNTENIPSIKTIKKHSIEIKIIDINGQSLAHETSYLN
ncbi:hypothetical protein GF374_03140 [Candidatus Woesearchaeota archaeon]|nr:hypothetical protein [Candidatus Woesearchaeota archaeon]